MSPCAMSNMLCAPPEASAVQEQHKSRRSNKPQMERRRRERINQCLNELKSLVLTAQKKDPSRYNKLEKADILEMTVRHVQTMHRQKGQSPRQQEKYYAGYTRCAAEVTKFLEGASGIPEDLRKRITSHLNTPTAISPSRISPKPEQCTGSNTVTTTVTVNPPRLTLSPGSSSNKQMHEGGAILLPLSSRVRMYGSPPTTATSPEAIGKPASPESAHGNSPHDLVSPGISPNINIYQRDHAMVQIRPEASCLNIETPVRLPQPKPQDVPLDLAFNRHNNNESSSSNGYNCPRRQNKSLKAAHEKPKAVRFIPYAPPNIQQNDLHWRPW